MHKWRLRAHCLWEMHGVMFQFMDWGDGFLTPVSCPSFCPADVDECAARMDRCNRSVSDCINTEGGYVCKCLEGYTGDGLHCHGMGMCEDSALSGRLRHSCLCDSFLPVWSVVTPATDQYAKPIVVSEYLLSVFALFLVAREGERGRVKGRREVEVKQ